MPDTKTYRLDYWHGKHEEHAIVQAPWSSTNVTPYRPVAGDMLLFLDADDGAELFIPTKSVISLKEEA